MPAMSHFVRRLVICRDSQLARAGEQARMKYQAFCQPATVPVGVEAWSWWNSETARYYPQNHVLPKLDYLDELALKERLRGDLERFETQLASGSSGNYPMVFPRLGWAHPWNTQYGGTTGGDEIETFSGVETAWTASRAGLRLSQLRMGAMVDRQPQVLFDKNGNHTTYQSLVEYPEGRPPYVPLWFYNVPSPGDEVFPFASAPSFQEEFVANQSMIPAYAGDLKGFMPCDYQHFIRYTHDLKTNAWLSNDALSKELLLAAAENHRLSFHEYPNSNYDHVQPTGLLNALRTVQQHPGLGAPIGRAEAWGVDCSIAVYAMGDDELRARYRPWFDNIATVYEQGQSTCTGNLMSYYISNHFGGLYRVRQAMENAFLENTAMGLITSVYRSVDDDRADSLEQVLVASVRSTLTGRFFNEAESAPYFNNATGPADINQGNFCDSAPPGTASSYVNRTEGYSSLAYAYELSGDSFFLFRASQILGGGDVWQRLQEGQGQNLHNTAALVALVQEMASSQP
ncbi:MAG: hypothetical protein R3E96_10675 [Planctomycetota bacterium]